MNNRPGGLFARRNLAAWIGIAFIGGLVFAGPWLLGGARAQDQDSVSAPVELVTIGQPWIGEPGITETVDEIMARDAANPWVWDGIPRSPEPRDQDGEEDEDEDQVDRTGLAQNPDSPWVSQWPPLPDDSDLDPAEGADVGGHHNGAPNLPQTIGTSFQAVVLSESGFIPPDTMGDVGPTQILVCENGRIKVFDKNGVLGALNTDTNTFFNSVRNASGTSDPRVRFDRLTGRWFVLMINVSSPNRIMLAVSSGPTITGAASFTFYQFQQDLVAPAGNTGQLADYPSLGVDANAVYTGANMFTSSFQGTTGWVIRKSSVLSGGPIVVTAFRGLAGAATAGPYAPRGVNNDDPAATEGYFIGPDNATFGTLMIRRVSTPGGTPTISGNISVTVPATTNPLSVPAQGSTTNLETSDDRLFAAEMHKNKLTGAITLWAAHHIQVNASGVASASGGRDGARWYQLQNMTSTPALVQSGTLFDSAATNPRYFFYPTCMMSGQGHMALGCSAAGAAEFPEVAVAGRLSGDTLGTIQAPTTAVTSSTSYTVVGGGRNRWGDYSHVVVDPADDMTMWAFEEYCNATNSWAVRAIRLIAPPPATPSSCSPASVAQGAAGVNVVLTGTSASGSGFFDPDVAFSNHIAAAVNGGLVTVNTITFTDPTHITLNVTVNAAAALGARTITVTNPDGQAATSASGILTITGGGCTAAGVSGQPSNQTVCSGGSASFSVTGTGTAPLSFQWRRGTTNLVNGGAISGATTATLTINPAATGDAGIDYNCVVTNACGSATSNNATLTVNTAAAITGQPSSATVCSGGSASFTVTASGSPAPTFQWRRGTTNLVNGGNISGATTATLTINPAGAGDAATNYNCVVTNSCGSATSNNATLTVNTAPAVTGQPSNVTLCSGGSASFAVSASGTPAPTFQWRRGATNLVNGGNISGATTATLTINPAGVGDAANNYNCVVTNSCGSATSNNATLTVNTAPAITAQPSNASAPVGGAATFTVGASGTTPLSFQWRKGVTNLVNGGSISGATTATLTVNPVQCGDSVTNYNCVVTNLCGSATSNNASLTTNAGPCPADLNGDNRVDVDDLAIVLGNFGRTGAVGYACGDLDGDGDVDVDDLAFLLARFGSTCP